MEAPPPRKVVRKKKHNSLQEKLDDVSSMLKIMQEMMVKKGFFAEEKGKSNTKENSQLVGRKQNKGSRGEINDNVNNADNSTTSQTHSNSETTIYREAVLPEQQLVVNKISSDKDMVQIVDNEISFHVKRKDSTSSDEQIDTSDELLDVDKFIADCQEDARRQSKESHPSGRDDQITDDGHGHGHHQSQADQVVKEAEASRARMIATPGNDHPMVDYNVMQCRQQATIVDENYLVIGNQVDESV